MITTAHTILFDSPNNISATDRLTRMYVYNFFLPLVFDIKMISMIFNIKIINPIVRSIECFMITTWLSSLASSTNKEKIINIIERNDYEMTI